MNEEKRFKNLCLEGGGIKGLGLAGAACYMDDLGIWGDLENFCGASAGSIFALLASLDYSPKQIKSIMFETDFSKFVDDESYFKQLRNFSRNYGIHSGLYFENFLKTLIKDKMKKEDATFKDIFYKTKKSLFVITSNVSTGYSQSFDAYNSPDMPVWLAVRMSMAIPFYFTSVKYKSDVIVENKKVEKECIFSDGGIFQNYPIRYFDDGRFCEEDEYGEYHNHQTIGFKLDSKNRIDIIVNHELPNWKNIKNIVNYTNEVISSLMNVQDNYFRDEDDWIRTIFIDTLGVTTTDFNISIKKKSELFNSGWIGAEKFFKGKIK